MLDRFFLNLLPEEIVDSLAILGSIVVHEDELSLVLRLSLVLNELGGGDILAVVISMSHHLTLDSFLDDLTVVLHLLLADSASHLQRVQFPRLVR